MEKHMFQQVVKAPGNIIFRKIPIPKISETQVLVKIHMIGICGSDIHVYHGQHPFTSYPITQGHEVSGEIVGLGSKISNFSIGQKVTIEPQVVCGNCYPCTHGKYNLCEELKVMGFQTTGTASTFFAVNADKVTPLPQSMRYEEGAMIEPLAVAVHAIRRLGDVERLKIVVIGSGPIGNLVAQVAKAMGAEVLVTDISDYRLQIAKKCGINHTVNTKTENLGDAILKHFGSDKADLIYDCAGNDITIGQAIRYARKGSKIILVAVFAKTASVDLATLNDHELDLYTSMMYRHEDYLTAIKLVETDKIKLEPLISNVFPFSQYNHAYKYIEENRETSMKVLINVNDDKDIKL